MNSTFKWYFDPKWIQKAWSNNWEIAYANFFKKSPSQKEGKKKKQCAALMNLRQALLGPGRAEEASSRVSPPCCLSSSHATGESRGTHAHCAVVTKTCALYFLISAELQSQRGGQVPEQVALRQVRRDWCLRQPRNGRQSANIRNSSGPGCGSGCVRAYVRAWACSCHRARWIHKSLRSLSRRTFFFESLLK